MGSWDGGHGIGSWIGSWDRVMGWGHEMGVMGWDGVVE